MRYTSPNLGFGIGFYRQWGIGIIFDSQEGFHLAVGPFAIWWIKT